MTSSAKSCGECRMKTWGWSYEPIRRLKLWYFVNAKQIWKSTYIFYPLWSKLALNPNLTLLSSYFKYISLSLSLFSQINAENMNVYSWPRVWRISTVKSKLLVCCGHWLLPSYVSIKNSGVTLTHSYCAVGTCGSDSVRPVNNLRGCLCVRLDVCHMFGDMSPLRNRLCHLSLFTVVTEEIRFGRA